MISVWWLIPAFFAGAMVGVFFFCLAIAGGDDR